MDGEKETQSTSQVADQEDCVVKDTICSPPEKGKCKTDGLQVIPTSGSGSGSGTGTGSGSHPTRKNKVKTKRIDLK